MWHYIWIVQLCIIQVSLSLSLSREAYTHTYIRTVYSRHCYSFHGQLSCVLLVDISIIFSVCRFYTYSSNIHTHIHTASTYTHIQICIHTYRKYICIEIYEQTCIQQVYTYLQIHIHPYIHTYNKYTCIQICIHTETTYRYWKYTYI